VALDGTGVELGAIHGDKTAGIERGEIEGGLACEDPLRDTAAGTAASGDARGKAASEEHVLEARCLAQDGLAVRRDRGRAVDQRAHADLVEHRQAPRGWRSNLREAVERAPIIGSVRSALPANRAVFSGLRRDRSERPVDNIVFVGLSEKQPIAQAELYDLRPERRSKLSHGAGSPTPTPHISERSDIRGGTI